MRIGIFTNNYLPNPYGSSSSIESFRRELERHGHEVYIFAPAWWGYRDENPHVYRYSSIDLIRYKLRFPVPIPFSFRLRKTIRSLKLDVIHAQQPGFLGEEGMRWARRLDIPCIFTWHALYDHYIHFFPPILPKRTLVKIANYEAVSFANRSDHVIVPTQSVKTIVEQLGVINSNITLLPTGVDEETFQNAHSQKIIQQFPQIRNKNVLLTISRMSEEKNVTFLIQSVAPLLKKYNNLIVIMGGEGSSLEILKAIVKEQGVTEQVIFSGMIERKDVKHFLSVADIFVYASKSETQGMVISEAMYMGVPIVAVDAPGVCDMVIDGETGILVNEDETAFCSAVEQLLDDEAKRKQFSSNAKTIARSQYTDKACTKRLLEVYTKAIQKKKA